MPNCSGPANQSCSLGHVLGDTLEPIFVIIVHFWLDAGSDCVQFRIEDPGWLVVSHPTAVASPRHP